MIRQEALGILVMNQREVVSRMQGFAEKAEKHDQLFTPPDPEASFGLTSIYKKKNHRVKQKNIVQKQEGYPGVGRNMMGEYR